MSEPVVVLGQDRLAQMLEAAHLVTSEPLTLVTDPARLVEALGEDGRLVALSAWSEGGCEASRRLGLRAGVASFGALVPLSEQGPTEISLPAGLTASERQRGGATLAEALGEVVEVAEGPGLVRPRLLACLINEAAHLLSENLAEAGEIDRALVLGMNHPRGPLAWADQIGLDVVERLLLALARAYGPAIYRPAPALARLVAAGHTGQAAGQGFFSYAAGGSD